MKLFLASGNAHKVAEFQALAAESSKPVEILSARAVGGMPAVEEDTGTFLGNARKKAQALRGKIPAGAVLATTRFSCPRASPARWRNFPLRRKIRSATVREPGGR